MKKLYFTLFALLFSAIAFGQKTEFYIALNSGVFNFNGSAASQSTDIFDSPFTGKSHAILGFGAQKALSYGISLNLRRVTKNKMLLGVDLGFEVLRSQASVDTVYGGDFVATKFDGTGKIFVNNSFLNLNPYTGYRFAFKDFSFDLTGGFDFAIRFKETIRGNATISNGGRITVFDRTTPNVWFDFRPRVQLAANYKKLGLYVGYSYGLVDYTMWSKAPTNQDGSNTSADAYARLLRFGVTYRIK